jgi:hypothetical protein
MRANVLWSILASGNDGGQPSFCRYIDIYNLEIMKPDPGIIDVLVPFSDPLLRAKYVEGLTQLVLKSSLRERALALDPVNTYEKATLSWPDAGAFYQATPSGELTITTQAEDEKLLEAGRGFVQTGLQINTGLRTLACSFGEFSYTMSGGLSSHLPLLPGLTLRLRFSTVSPAYSVDYSYVADAKVDWVATLARAKASEPEWDDPLLRDIWENDPIWTNRLAAFVLSAVEARLRANE